MSQVHDSGRLVGVGAGDGSTSVLSLDPELVTATKAERGTALDMLEREAMCGKFVLKITQNKEIHSIKSFIYVVLFSILGERESSRTEPRL